jgi:hypothetical protein
MLRGFVGTFRCAINTSELSSEERPEGDEPTLEEVKAYLQEALRVDFDMEDCGNAVGISSVEVDIEGLKEISPEEVARVYGDPNAET